MSLEKTELRAAGMHEVGVRLDDGLEAAKAEVLRAEGAIQAGQKAMERTVQLIAAVDKENADGGLNDDQRQVVKKFLAKCHVAMKSVFEEATNRMLVARGMVAGIERAIKTTKNLYDLELSKVGVSGSTDDGGVVVPIQLAARAIGQAPKMSIKQQRLAEEAAVASVGFPEAEPITVPEPVLESVPKPRKRKSKKV